MNNIKVLFFDLDGCLYPRSSGVDNIVHVRINKYIREKLGIKVEGDYAYDLYVKYGLTVLGLHKEGHKVDFKDYHDYVHDIDITKYVPMNLKLKKMLERVRQKHPHIKVYVCSNADTAHCKRTLKALGIENEFDGMFCFDSSGIDCKFAKPSIEYYQYVMKTLGVSPNECLFCDDSKMNCISAAQKLGIKTFWIDENFDNSKHHYEEVDGVIRVKYVTDLEKIERHLFD